MTDKPQVLKHSYGKSQVRVSRIHRAGKRHEVIEATLCIQLQGEFEASYSAADNSLVIATDTMKNTVYVLASRHGIDSIEAFALIVARHFLDSYQHIQGVEVCCEQSPWARMSVGGAPHAHAFVGGTTERFTCEVRATRQQTSLRSGFKGLQVLKSTESGFSNFHRDPLTTLPDTDDRIFATTIEAEWPCRDLAADWTGARSSIRGAFLEVFATRYSPSVQSTLYEMGQAALAACASIDEISITMPNQHHLLANLQPFGLTNPNEVFVPTSEPFGLISATIGRSGAKEAP